MCVLQQERDTVVSFQKDVKPSEKETNWVYLQLYNNKIVQHTYVTCNCRFLSINLEIKEKKCIYL